MVCGTLAMYCCTCVNANHHHHHHHHLLALTPPPPPPPPPPPGTDTGRYNMFETIPGYFPIDAVKLESYEAPALKAVVAAVGDNAGIQAFLAASEAAAAAKAAAAAATDGDET